MIFIRAKLGLSWNFISNFLFI